MGRVYRQGVVPEVKRTAERQPTPPAYQGGGVLTGTASKAPARAAQKKEATRSDPSPWAPDLNNGIDWVADTRDQPERSWESVSVLSG